MEWSETEARELIRLKLEQGFKPFGFGKGYVWARTLKKAKKKARKLGYIKTKQYGAI
jgi:hypothetical protein